MESRAARGPKRSILVVSEVSHSVFVLYVSDTVGRRFELMFGSVEILVSKSRGSGLVSVFWLILGEIIYFQLLKHGF